MGKIEDISYIENVGIKETIRTTTMGNVIHILNNGKKYKEFSADYKNLDDSINVLLRDDLISQTEEYGNPVISFPEIVISSEKELFGIVGDYEIGQPLPQINQLTSINQMIRLVEILEKEIYNLSLKGWNLEDLHEENILINLKSLTKPIRIIDTDYYCLQSNRDKIEIYRQNIKKIFRAVIESLLPELLRSNLIQENLKNDYLLASNGLMKTSEFLKYLLTKVTILYDEPKNIKTLRKTL